jgi:hypothetical protein
MNNINNPDFDSLGINYLLSLNIAPEELVLRNTHGLTLNKQAVSSDSISVVTAITGRDMNYRSRTLKAIHF